MKTFKHILFSLMVMLSSSAFSQGHFRVKSDELIQIGYSTYKALTFGISNTNPNNGRYSIEHDGGGLNIWKPWPSEYSGNYVMYFRDDRHIGINSTGNNYHYLYVNGAIASTAYWTISDKRFKSDIKTIDKSLDKIRLLNGVTYRLSSLPEKNTLSHSQPDTEIKRMTMQAEKDSIDQSPTLGFIAQDLQKVFPELVKEDDHGILTVNYQGLIPVLVEALKEQQNEIETLRKQVSEIKSTSTTGSLDGNVSNVGIKASLHQNYPNPFSVSTTISYSIEQDFQNAEIIVFDLNGNIQLTFPIQEKGSESIEIAGGTLGKGAYHYSLVINGVIVDTKQMILLNK